MRTMDAMASDPPLPCLSPIPNRHRDRRRRAVATALALALAVVACAAAAGCTACTSDAPQQAPGGRIRPATTTTTAAPVAAHRKPSKPPAPQTPEQKVAAAYREAKAVYFDALLDPWHPDDRLASTRIDPNLRTVQYILKTQASDGIVSRYPHGRRPIITVRAVEVHDRNATVLACQIDDAIQVRTSDGSVKNGDALSSLDRADMEFTKGRWKVRSETGIKAWADRGGCDR